MLNKNCDNCNYKGNPRCLLSPYTAPINCVANNYSYWKLKVIEKEGKK